MDVWMDGRMDRWLVGWMDGLDGWLDGLMNIMGLLPVVHN